MKKLLLMLLLPALGMTGCLKDNEDDCKPTWVSYKAPDSEISALRGILAGSGISTQEDPRGFFYKITPAGGGDTANTCSAVNLNYVAKLLSNGTTVDSNNNVTYRVKAFIVGWQEALPLMHEGDSMTLYVPPSLAYGSVANGPIPASSNLQFNIRLRAVQ